MNSNNIIKKINEFNNTTVEYPSEKTIVQLFEEQVSISPEKVAAVFEDRQITYGELNERANGIAIKLRASDVKPNDFVAVICDRSIEMLIGIYGIIKAGGAYVPIDTSYPLERIQYILSDCKPKAILTYGTVVDSEIPIIDLALDSEIQNEPRNLQQVNNPDDILYLIYTSGTTGNPKGVMIKHSCIVNFSYNSTCGIMKPVFDNGYSRIACVNNLAFDLSVTETVFSLVNGMTIYIANSLEQKITEDFEKLVLKHEIEILQTTPSRVKIFLSDDSRREYLKRLKFIMLAGEKFDLTLFNQLKQYTDAIIVNSYGPTETTIVSTGCVVNDFSGQEELIVGKPISNTQVYILDGMELCDIGEKGEICIAGSGVAKGYLNLSELTKEKFIDNPFGNGKLYRSGDMGCWRIDGNIEIQGRKDDQVKIRGYRIELGEIDSVIRKIDDIKDVTVIARENKNGDKEINAYIISENALIISKVRDELSAYLPEYMLPTKMMKIDALPVTANGKVDKKALPEIEEVTESFYVAATSPLEEELVQLWEEMLFIDSIGIDDNFIELGGHSLIAIKMVYRINEMYDINLSILELLTNGLTVRTLSQIIEEKLFDSLSEEELANLLSELDD